MGFKSVLEISEAPEVYSTTTCFRFSPADALLAVQPLVDEGVVEEVKRAPICRFPWAGDELVPTWLELLERGFRTAFRFPLRAQKKEEHHARLAQTLRGLPISSLVFLKRLNSIELDAGSLSFPQTAWTVNRQQYGTGKDLVPSPTLSRSGVYQVDLTNGHDTSHRFTVAYDAEIAIGDHRGGLNEFVWDGVEITEAAVAAHIVGGRASALPVEWRRLHVFLPSGEPCPYDLLISAAFSSNLSRQQIKVETVADGYNRHVVRHAARLFRDELVPGLLRTGSNVHDVVRLLSRGDATGNPGGATQAVHEAFKEALARFPLIPTEAGVPVPISECAVPPIVEDDSVGEAYRSVLPVEAAHEQLAFPIAGFCSGTLARILADLGAHELNPMEAAVRLSDADAHRSRLKEHSSGGVWVDPVLSVLEGLWSGFNFIQRDQFVTKVRELRLFPVAHEDGLISRISTRDLQCFYPPRSLRGEVGLSGLCFLLQELCWGALTPPERNQVLAKEMPIWQGLFELHEFKFPDVMRASVLPSLDLDSDSSDPRRFALRTLDSLAAICQLAGRIPDASKPLPYERLGSNRALFNLSRLDVPCRSGNGDAVKWVPAYRAYLGEDWVGEASFEGVCKAITALGKTPPDVDFVVAPRDFLGLRDRFSHLRPAAAESQDVGADEVDIDEDEESALESRDQDQWLGFFRWLGVNVSLRAVHFHDVEDRASGWLKTRGLRKPEGRAFSAVTDEQWTSFHTSVFGDVKVKAAIGADPESQPYFYQLHDLEHLSLLLDAAARDETAAVGKALYGHLARNWVSFQRFCQLEIAVVGGEPTRRTKPPRARDEEIVVLDERNFWLDRLRAAAVCPTGHGPRKPAEVWLPSQEVIRRFGRKSREGTTTCLIPTLELPPTLLRGRSKGLTQAVGIREELSPTSFTAGDALVVLRRLETRYSAFVADSQGLRQELRDVIRPAYRHVLDLLSDRAGIGAVGTLRNAPVPAQDGLGRLEFRPASSVFYAERRDTLDRLKTTSPLWTLILEAHHAGRAALVDLFGCRVLEESLEWSPEVGEHALPDEDTATWRNHLHYLAPYLLARVGADRVEDSQVRRDASRLRNLIAALEPVQTLRLSCRLDGQTLSTTSYEREAFVDLHTGQSDRMTAFVCWGEGVWPPTEDDAEALAMAFGEVLGSGYFESFLALVRAPSDAKRRDLLRRAGAPTDIDYRRLLLRDESDPSLEPQEVEEKKTITTPLGPELSIPTSQPASPDGEQPRQVPLYSLEQITVGGVPATLLGDPGSFQEARERHPAGGSDDDKGSDLDQKRGKGYGGHTDLDELNTIGMGVTLAYEVNRLRRGGCADVEVFDVAAPTSKAKALVFDVSTPSKIERARTACTQFDRAFKKLIKDYGVSAEWPGFDVLTLQTIGSDEVDRLIELKSSGVSSRVQGMSWNEWKSARTNALRHRFYLYLVGNLRSDLKGSFPFVRAIQDPFGQLMADVQVNKRVERKVQLAVDRFQEAEHLDLAIRAPRLGSPADASQAERI